MPVTAATLSLHWHAQLIPLTRTPFPSWTWTVEHAGAPRRQSDWPHVAPPYAQVLRNIESPQTHDCPSADGTDPRSVRHVVSVQVLPA